jgi:circadian clock protein KaiC
MEGVSRGEPALYVTLSETAEELAAAAESHGWSLDGIRIRELIPSEESLRPDAQSTVFHPSEIELGQTTAEILAEAEAVRPTRVVLDSLSELRLLAGSELRYRRQVIALKQFFAKRGCTTLMLDDRSGGDQDRQLRSVANGIVVLEQHHPAYGAERRRLLVVKHRADEVPRRVPRLRDPPRGGDRLPARRRGGGAPPDLARAAEHGAAAARRAARRRVSSAARAP